MNSPLSAFSVYKTKQNKNQNNKKKKKQKNTKLNSPNTRDISKEVLMKAGRKLKEKNKKVMKKDIKKKNTKKLKSKKNETTAKINKRRVRSPEGSDVAEEFVPRLVSALPDNGHYCDLSQSSGDSIDFTPVQTHSVEEGSKVFQWMIAPYDTNQFLNSIWEKKPLHISRRKASYYKEIISTQKINDMLRDSNILFTKNIDITSFADGKRETHNPVGRAHPHVVWDYYLNGCSIRLLNPQTYIPQLHLVNATLQEFFNSFVGANAYLTPPDSQGFAPHYDDIEAFILQIEGKKHWRIYKPLSENETMPRVSSKNYDQNEIGHPILEVTLEAGDMLYFPRGYIHQGITIDGEHSLHITVSMYQKHCWADLFEKMIPVALQSVINDDVELRRGLPFDIYENFGLVNSDLKTLRRKELKDRIMMFFDRVKNSLDIDSAVDQMSKNYQEDALPPVLTDLEKAVTVYGESVVMVANGVVSNRVEIGLDTRIRLLRKNIIRMVMEDRIRLYYHTENSLEYHGNEPQFLEIDENLAPAVETLIIAYPAYVAVENLDVESDADKLQVANDLWERGIVMTEYPLESIDE